MSILGINFGKKEQTAPKLTSNESSDENISYEKFIVKQGIKNDIKYHQSLFEYLKKELFDNIVNKDGNFSGEHELKSRNGNILFKAKGTINMQMYYEYFDKTTNQNVSFEDSNGDGIMNCVLIRYADGATVSAYDKDDDGSFDIVNKKNKDSTIEFEEMSDN